MLQFTLDSGNVIFAGEDVFQREYVAAVPAHLALLSLQEIKDFSPVKMTGEEQKNLRKQIFNTCGRQSKNKRALDPWRPIIHGQASISTPDSIPWRETKIKNKLRSA